MIVVVPLLTVAALLGMVALLLREAARRSEWPASSSNPSDLGDLVWSATVWAQLGRFGLVRNLFAVQVRQQGVVLRPLFPLSAFLAPLCVSWPKITFAKKVWVGATWELWWMDTVLFGVSPAVGRRFRDAKPQSGPGQE